MYISEDTRKNANAENIAGHCAIHVRQMQQALPNLRGLKFHNLDTHTAALVDYAERCIKDMAEPDIMNQTMQALEWQLSQVVIEAGKIIQDAGTALEACRDVRLGTATMKRLMDAKKVLDACKGK